eukprot:jgi/Psemu1/258097/estExt_Genewise1Plus.C_2600056
MKLDPDIPIVQNEAAIMTTLAAELFLKRLANQSQKICKNRGKNTIRYEDVADARSNDPSLAFLKTIYSVKVKEGRVQKHNITSNSPPPPPLWHYSKDPTTDIIVFFYYRYDRTDRDDFILLFFVPDLCVLGARWSIVLLFNREHSVILFVPGSQSDGSS